jgi:hypothetical protein
VVVVVVVAMEVVEFQYRHIRQSKSTVIEAAYARFSRLSGADSLITPAPSEARPVAREAEQAQSPH